MTALLGLLAVAGYQNRDKIAEMLGNRTAADGAGDTFGGVPNQGQARPAGLEGILGNLTKAVGGGGLGSLLGGGLGQLADQFKQNGHGETVESWVGSGANKSVAPNDLERAIGPDVLEDLSEQTGLSREELLSRLSRELPDAVNNYTPHGRLPTEDDMKA
jgi:uncharacterized protein YidB (DUF937 family)